MPSGTVADEWLFYMVSCWRLWVKCVQQAAAIRWVVDLHICSSPGEEKSSTQGTGGGLRRCTFLRGSLLTSLGNSCGPWPPRTLLRSVGNVLRVWLWELQASSMQIRYVLSGDTHLILGQSQNPSLHSERKHSCTCSFYSCWWRRVHSQQPQNITLRTSPW